MNDPIARSIYSPAAERLRANRDRIAIALATLVADWPKYADQYGADPAGFAQLETAVLVDYMAALIDSGDHNYRHQYVGEKVKQLHDLSVDQDEDFRRRQAIATGERAIFRDALRGDDAGQRLIDQHCDVIEHLLTAPAVAELRVLFVGDCLFLDLMGFLTAPALEDGVRLRPTFVTTHDAAAIRTQLGALADQRFDLVAFSPFTYALLDDYGSLQRPRGVLDPKRLGGHVRAATREALETFDVLADLFDCPIVTHLPAPVIRHGAGVGERVRAALIRPAMARACRALNQALRTRAAQRNAAGQVVHLLDEAAAAQPDGLWQAGRWLYQSQLQHPAALGAMLAAPYRDLVIVAARLLKSKLVVCDLDNTLWHGVIGEGLGITHHYSRQAPLLTLKERGVLLAINSKNDPAKATWIAEAGRLAIDDFVSQQINWDPKSINMQRIVDHLNLKAKDFVFIDDRADERAMVEQQFPAMLTLDALDPRSWRLLELWAELMPRKPNADRTEFYRQRDQRQKFIATEADVSAQQRSEMLAQLKLELVVRQAGDADLDRVADLINRTNQFNMTGGRITRRQVQEYASSDDALILIADGSDRFGEMGTISVLIAARTGGQLTIPFFVLSCRVFGYAMEFAVLDEARKFAHPGETIFGPLVETAFNQPCRSVYAMAGFAPVPDGWQLADAAVPIALATWLTVKCETSDRIEPVQAAIRAEA